MSFCTFYEIINTSKNSRMSQTAKKVWWIILKCRLLFYLTDTVSVTLDPSMVRCFGAMTLLTTTTCTISCRLLPLMTFDKTILFTIKEYRKVTAIKKKDWMLVKYFIVALIFMIRFKKKWEKYTFLPWKINPQAQWNYHACNF